MTAVVKDKATRPVEFKVWDGIYASFQEAPAVGLGFAGPIWRERSMQAAREAARSLAAGETLDYALRQRNAMLPPIAAMMLSQHDGLSILDFGGGLGTAYLVLAAAIGNAISRVAYRVVEVEGICNAARELFPDGAGPCFQSDLPTAGSFDIVYASSVMQYIEDWQAVVRRLAHYRAPYLVFGDVFLNEFRTFVTLQNYYDSRIPQWFVNADEFIGEVKRQGYRLVLRATCDVKIAGNYGPMPMNNFPTELRVPHTAHLVFARIDGESSG